MSGDVSTPGATHGGPTRAGVRRLQLAAGAFGGGTVAFFAGSGILAALGGTPPSATPTASMTAHLLWFVAVACLATGAAALVLWSDDPGPDIAGYLALGALGLGVLHGLQWAAWSYVDVLAASQDQYDLLLDGLISRFGAAHAIMYAMLVGGGVAALGWTLRRRQVTHRYIDRLGVVLGAITVVIGMATLLAVSAPWTSPMLFGATVLLIPLSYLWTSLVAVDISRRWWHPVASS